MLPHLTVVEDDPVLLASLKELIEENNYLFSGYESAEGFSWASDLSKIDMLIVDRNLPGEDGISLVKKIRKNYPQLPIMFLTTTLSDEDIVEGLDAGANDYVSKPFISSILLARIRACLRKGKMEMEKGVGVDWSINETTREVIINSDKYSLSTREFQIFKVLSSCRGEVVAREELLKIDESISTRNVDVHIVALRKKLDNTGILIQTIRGVGYRVQ